MIVERNIKNTKISRNIKNFSLYTIGASGGGKSLFSHVGSGRQTPYRERLFANIDDMTSACP